MPVADHFDTLAIYGAAAYRITPADGDPEDLLGEGGNLQARYEEHGRRALVGVLRDASIKAVLMGDGDLIVEVQRSGSGARLQVTWGDDNVVDEQVEIPPMRAGTVVQTRSADRSARRRRRAQKPRGTPVRRGGRGWPDPMVQ